MKTKKATKSRKQRISYPVHHHSKTVYLDIETAPSTGYYFDKWKENNIVATIENWYILSYAYKVEGEKTIHCRALPDYPGYKKDKTNDRALLVDLLGLMNDADIIIAHNGDRFDIRKINARILVHNLGIPSPYKTVDTLKVARKYFMFDSNRLDEVSRYLGVGGKLPHLGIKMWKDCMAGDMKMWKMMKEYNKQDIVLLENLYHRVRGWMTNHPNVNLVDAKRGSCPTCGSERLQKRGLATVKGLAGKVITKGPRKVQRLQCTECGSWTTAEIDNKLVL